MGILNWIRSLFGGGRDCGCGGGRSTVLVSAQTLAPDQPLKGDLPGTVRSLGNDFIYEVVPVMGLRIQEAPRQTKLAQVHLWEKDRATTAEALGALVEGNGDRIPSGFRLTVDSGEASLDELRLGQDGDHPPEVTLRAVYSYADGSPEISSDPFPAYVEFRYESPNLNDDYFGRELHILWYCFATWGGTGKSKKKGWTVCDGWCFPGDDCLCRGGAAPAGVCLGWLRCKCL